MIINTGMRTDIPAFYAPWFLNRLREGFVLVRNPYQPEQVTRYSLSPDVVDLIGPAPRTRHPCCPIWRPWNLTVSLVRHHYPLRTGRGTGGASGGPGAGSFRQLAEQVGPDRIGWRYDPIFLF